jgi:hypothetical protein
VTATLETELRAAYTAIEHAKDELAHASTPELRAVVYRELVSGQLSISRVLHLIAGCTCNGEKH